MRPLHVLACVCMQTTAGLLEQVQQSAEPRVMSALQPVAQALAQPQHMKNKDKEVKLFLALCISHILRIFAPEAPYNDETLKVCSGTAAKQTV